MIVSFGDNDAAKLFRGERVPRFIHVEAVARRKLALLHAATSLAFLQAPPGNRLEALKGDRAGQHSIRINDQYRLCFRWFDGDAFDVHMVDYH